MTDRSHLTKPPRTSVITSLDPRHTGTTKSRRPSPARACPVPGRYAKRHRRHLRCRASSSDHANDRSASRTAGAVLAARIAPTNKGICSTLARSAGRLGKGRPVASVGCRPSRPRDSTMTTRTTAHPPDYPRKCAPPMRLLVTDILCISKNRTFFRGRSTDGRRIAAAFVQQALRGQTAIYSLPATFEFPDGLGQYVATLVQWPSDCTGLHSVWEPISPS
jgi:hypothetical protein